ncbi:MAG: hypothetical protein AVO33_00605 [delta proteobacterium ML8_F1]|nr:MAG: hypothetical protein AVO33_00605 [delta proteobacterium ML8_F1]
MIVTEHLLDGFTLPPYIENIRWGLIDIETTGLNRATTHVVMVGLILPVDGEIRLRQYTLEDLKEEILMLTELMGVLDSLEALLNFNGTHFDLPYLNRRFEHHRIPFEIPLYKSFDLYRYFKENRRQYPLENLKLKTLEKHFGILREDTLAGGDFPRDYFLYLASRNQGILNGLLTHNREDLVHLARLFEIIYHKDQRLLQYGPKMFYIEGKPVYIQRLTQSMDLLYLSLESTASLPAYAIWDKTFRIDTALKKPSVQLPVLTFERDFEEMTFADSKALFDKDFDHLKGPEREALLLIHNGTLRYDNLGRIITKKLSLI